MCHTLAILCIHSLADVARLTALRTPSARVSEIARSPNTLRRRCHTCFRHVSPTFTAAARQRVKDMDDEKDARLRSKVASHDRKVQHLLLQKEQEASRSLLVVHQQQQLFLSKHASSFGFMYVRRGHSSEPRRGHMYSTCCTINVSAPGMGCRSVVASHRRLDCIVEGRHHPHLLSLFLLPALYALFVLFIVVVLPRPIDVHIVHLL